MRIWTSIENAFWNTANTVGQVFNPTTAKQWYAQQALNAGVSNPGNWVGNGVWATGMDIAGGYVSMWTGSPATQHQAYAAAALSAPTFGFGGAVGSAISGTQQFVGAFSAINTSINSWITGSPVNPLSGGLQLVGLTGNAIGNAAKALGWAGNAASTGTQSIASMLFKSPTGQYTFGFAWDNATLATNLSSASYLTSGLRFGNKIGEALGMGLNQVGGVLFNRCADVLTNIGEIVGAYWDSNTGSLVLVGKDARGAQRTFDALPSMDADHLRVAMRAALAGHPPGVSIDPPARYRYARNGATMLPDKTPLLVSYLGGTEDTLFGAILFEADRFLKSLSSGSDNVTRESISCSVPGYKSLLELAHAHRGAAFGGPSWHRFWFVIERVELRHDLASGALAFGDVRLRVLNEVELRGGRSDDPADEAFVRHLTEHYERYAGEIPVFARLKELAKVAAVAQFVAKQNLPLDLRQMFLTPVQHVETPKTTPSLLATSSVSDGQTVHTISMCGGVDFKVDPEVVPDSSATASRLKLEAEGSRPSPKAMEWTFGRNGNQSRAKAIRLGKAGDPFRWMQVDDQATRAADDLFKVRRIYDSARLGEGDFGPGWHLWVPFSLTVGRPDGKRAEVLSREETENRIEHVEWLVLHDHREHVSALYRLISGERSGVRPFFARVKSQKVLSGSVSFTYDATDRIEQSAAGYACLRDGRTWLFDAAGHLSEVRHGTRVLAVWHWQSGRLTAVKDTGDRGFTVYRSCHGSQLVERVETTGGTLLEYGYSPTGLLLTVRRGGQPPARLAYDGCGRLAEVRDEAGAIIIRAVYNDAGEHVSSGRSQTSTAAGHRLESTVTRGRVVQVKDEAGGTGEFSYSAGGALEHLRLITPSGRCWVMDYDANGFLRAVTNPYGNRAQVCHGENGELQQVRTVAGETWSLSADSDNRSASLTGPGGMIFKMTLGAGGRLERVTSSEGDSLELRYNGPLVSEVKSRRGRVRIMPNREHLRCVFTAEMGGVYTRIFDRRFRTVSVKSSLGGTATMKYDEIGQTCRVNSKAGEIRQHFDCATGDYEVSFDCV